MTSGSSRWGAAATTAANLAENSPKLRCWLRRSMRPRTAASQKAAGADVIGFGAGEPDFPTPEHIVAAAEKACRDPRFHHYTPTAGLPELRQAVADKTSRDLGFAVEAAQVLITNGAKQAVANSF